MTYQTKIFERSAAYGLGLVGLGLSAFALIHHFQLKSAGVTGAVCNVSDSISCDRVAGSAFSEVASVPLAVFGLAYFIAVLISLPKTGGLGVIYRALAIIGSLVSLVLAGISHFMVHAYCLVCMGVYVVTWMQLFLSLRSSFVWPHAGARTSIQRLVVVSSLTFLGTALAYQWLLHRRTAEVFAELRNQPQVFGPTSTEAPEAWTLAPPVVIPTSTKDDGSDQEDYAIGLPGAPLTMIVFADFECPFCADLAPVLKDLRRSFAQELRITFKNLPVDPACNASAKKNVHEHSCLLATLARCAGMQGRFWDFHDLAFANQWKLSKFQAARWAQDVGLTPNDVTACLESSRIKKKIASDLEIAGVLRLQETPAIFFNFRRYRGPIDKAHLRQVVSYMLPRQTAWNTHSRRE